MNFDCKKILLFVILLLLPNWIDAQVSITEKNTSIVTPEAHLFATFVKSFDHGLSLTFEEEIRSAPSHRSHTTPMHPSSILISMQLIR